MHTAHLNCTVHPDLHTQTSFQCQMSNKYSRASTVLFWWCQTIKVPANKTFLGSTSMSTKHNNAWTVNNYSISAVICPIYWSKVILQEIHPGPGNQRPAFHFHIFWQWNIQNWNRRKFSQGDGKQRPAFNTLLLLHCPIVICDIGDIVDINDDEFDACVETCWQEPPCSCPTLLTMALTSSATLKIFQFLDHWAQKVYIF